MNTYALETKDGCRFDVKASTIQAAYNKVKSIPHLTSTITGYYWKYDRDGFHANYLGWEVIPGF